MDDDDDCDTNWDAGVDIPIDDACNRVFMTSNGLVMQDATVPAAPPDIKLLFDDRNIKMTTNK